MKKVSTEHLEYLNPRAKLEFYYSKKTIDRLCRVYGLNRRVLTIYLKEVVEAFDLDANYYYRKPIWEEGFKRIDEIIAPLTKAKKKWERTPPRVRQTIDDLSMHGYSSDELISDLHRVIGLLQEARTVPRKRERGERFTSTQKDNPDPVPDLRSLYRVSEFLYDLWKLAKNEPMAAKTRGPFYITIGKQVRRVYSPASPGLRFMYRCLKRLDNRVTVQNCVTRINHLRREDRQAAQ